MSNKKDVENSRAEKAVQLTIHNFFSSRNPTVPLTAITLPDYDAKRDYKQVKKYVKKKIAQEVDKRMSWQGYCFIASNNFSEYSIINTIDRPDKFTKRVYEAGMKVGSATVDENSALTNIEIVDLFRRKGLGKKLISFINGCCKKFHVFAGTDENSRYRLTEEGAKLIRHCQQEGILEKEQVILDYVPTSPSLVQC